MACTLFLMGQNLAVRSKRPVIKVQPTVETGLETEITHEQIREHAAYLLSCGYSAKKVANSMVSFLSPTANPRSAYHKLTRWMREDQAFRDLIFNQSVLRLDLKTPHILEGIARKAADGRVDAARLALEITGRHTSHEGQVTSVTVNLNNIPRPQAET